MKVLIVGSGGREHALAWAVAKSARSPQVFVAPGNPGTATLATNVNIPATDVEALVRFAREQQIDLTVVGPEQPLVEGLVDRMEAEGLAVVGPSAAAARLEGSKVFAKEFMDRYGIPTAAHRSFGETEYDEACAFIRATGAPVVVKTDGLAAGKGAIVCATVEEALEAARAMLKDGAFGAAGCRMVVEEYMEGEEASVFALTDGQSYLLLPPAQDHKRIGEGDTGPNTGGMGAYAPAPIMTHRLLTQVCHEIIEPTLGGMLAEGSPYRGFLYVGLMIGPQGPRVVEYNCRLGDPEAQVVLPLLEVDVLDLLSAVACRSLEGRAVAIHPGAAACVVLAAEGYPGAYARDREIEGIEQAALVPGAMVFHAGTREDGAKLLTSGGRVLNVVGLGDDLAGALKVAYQAADLIHFTGVQYRRDIGRKGLDRQE